MPYTFRKYSGKRTTPFFLQSACNAARGEHQSGHRYLDLLLQREFPSDF